MILIRLYRSISSWKYFVKQLLRIVGCSEIAVIELVGLNTNGFQETFSKVENKLFPYFLQSFFFVATNRFFFFNKSNRFIIRLQNMSFQVYTIFTLRRTVWIPLVLEKNKRKFSTKISEKLFFIFQLHLLRVQDVKNAQTIWIFSEN